MLMTFQTIAERAGFAPGAAGKLNLPATQETADTLAGAAVSLLPSWQPGDEPVDLTLTGAGPVRAYLVVAHALHGRVRTCTYASPNAPAITVFSHGGQ